MSIHLTPEQEAQRKKRLEQIPNEAKALQEAEQSIANVISDMYKTNDLNEAYWKYLHNDIITNYEQEKKFLNGQYVLNPVTLDEVRNNSIGIGRLNAGPNVNAPLRIPEFDFGGLSSNPYLPNEQSRAMADANIFSFLRVGFNDGPNPTSATQSAITNSSNYFLVNDTANIVSGRRYLIRGSSSSAIIKCNNVSGVSAPYLVSFQYYNLDSIFFDSDTMIESGASILGSKVFSNTERSSKVANIPSEQNVLNKLLNALPNSINLRKAAMDGELSALNANADDNLDPNAKLNIQSTKILLDNFLANPNHSDSGLNAIEAVLNNRNSFVNNRISAISTILSSSSKFYDKRYIQADIIGNKSTGSYAMYKRNTDVQNVLASQKTMLQTVSGVYS